jgi:phosphoribosylamine--glycine ligase
MRKDVLLIGSGGREHALAWKLNRSPRLGHLYVAPGNAGTAANGLAENVPIKATDVKGLLEFALAKRIDLTIVGPDDPLALGIVDAFQERGLRIFGPTKAAAQTEASKAFAKTLMAATGVPTAKHQVYKYYDAAAKKIIAHFKRDDSIPIVIKASGLALGKGAYVCYSRQDAMRALNQVMLERVHGEAGDTVVIEEFVDGPEVSIHALTDGIAFTLFPAAQDHKPAFNGNLGPNTGGMGTIAPVPGFAAHGLVKSRVVEPILSALRKQGSPFVGCLYPGLKMSSEGPMVLEYNARFGDPETQVYMRLLESDLLDLIDACIDGTLDEHNVKWRTGFAVCVVLASEGYPSSDYKKGVPITGTLMAETVGSVVVFHAGTALKDTSLVTSGGRVLGVTAIGDTLESALDQAYKGVSCIRFEGMHFRTDIGKHALLG